MTHTPTISRVVDYLQRHQASFGVLLASYGAFYLAAVIAGNWTPADWGKDVFAIPPFPNAIIQRSYISPFFFLTSLPALLVGAVLLCNYSLRQLHSANLGVGERVATVLTAFGFFYFVVGTWPLTKPADFAWEWQKQIASFGLPFVWLLELLCWGVLIVGAFSLFMYSRSARGRHPELFDGF